MRRQRPEAHLVLVTAPTAREARTLARVVVGERLAACVNVVGPLRSIYRWQGKVEQAREYLLLIKTRPGLYPKLERRILELHSYDVPEVLAVPLDSGARPYLAWLLASTAVTPAPARARARLAPRAAAQFK